MQRIGIYGGSFNPIHNGHLILAQSVLDNENFDKILFLPNGFNPFKTNLDEKTRKSCLSMLKAGIEDNPKFGINTIELDNEGKKYTYNTIKTLKEENPETEFSFILGSDLLNDLDKWYRFDELTKLINFIVVKRPGISNVSERIKELKDKYNANIKLIKTPEIEISSTTIRNRIRNDQSVKYLTPDPVMKIIDDQNLYKETDNFRKVIKFIKKDLKKKLKPKRYEHSINVMKTAKDLALRYDVDIVKAQIAGLVHDCAKSLTIDEMLELAKEKNYSIPEEFIINPATLHAVVGALLAEEKYGVFDQEVLEAIKKHTTGSKKMSKLDKIIFLADYIEPGRKGDYVDEVRKLAENNLDQAVLKALDNTINYLKENNNIINPSSLEAREGIIKEINNGRK